MHLKNFSLIEKSENSNIFLFSPAYDLLPVNVVNPLDNEEFALTMNGKKRNLHRNDFLKYSDSIGLSRKVAERLIDKVVNAIDSFVMDCQISYLPDYLKTEFILLIKQRREALIK